VNKKEDIAAFSGYAIKQGEEEAPSAPPASPSSGTSKPVLHKDYPKHIPGRHKYLKYRYGTPIRE